MAIATAIEETGPVNVTTVVIAEAAEVEVPAILAQQTKTLGKKLAQQTGISDKSATLLFLFKCVRVRPKIRPLTGY